MPQQVRRDKGTINQDVEFMRDMPQQVRGDGTINQDVESACGMPRKMRGRQ